MGSAHYFSPEQAKGICWLSNRYLFFRNSFIWNGNRRLPFDAETPVTIALKHIHRASWT